VKIHKQALHWVYLKVQGVEINFINTVTEVASNDSKISSLVSGLVWVSWSRLLIINTKSFVEKTTRIFTGLWTLATSSRWSQSPPLCFLVTVAWFFSIRLTSITLNRWRTESTFYNKSNKLLFLSIRLRHTLLDKQLSRFNKFLHALVFVDTLNSFRRLLGSVISFPQLVQTVAFDDKEISILQNAFVDPLSPRWSNCMKCTHQRYTPFYVKIIRAKIFNAI
jgi:hypothetical protein